MTEKESEIDLAINFIEEFADVLEKNPELVHNFVFPRHWTKLMKARFDSGCRRWHSKSLSSDKLKKSDIMRYVAHLIDV